MRKTITVGLLVLFSLSIFNFGFLNTISGDIADPTIYTIATWDNDIVVDGIFDDWDNTNVSFLDIFYSDVSTGDSLQSVVAYIPVTYNFAYNDSYLFFMAFIPASQGHVKAMDVHFFGKPDTNDGVHMNAYHPEFLDLAFPDSENNESTPMPDEYYGGSNDAISTAIYMDDNGTSFEFAKKIRSGDSNGKDIWLNYGEAIAVEFAAWINVFPADQGPNYGSITPDFFSYARIDIGDNIGDTLQIIPDNPNGDLGWIESTKFQAPYSTGTMTIDGNADESTWSDATTYSLTLEHFNFSTGVWDQLNTLDITLKVFHDGTNYYIYLEFLDSYETTGDWVGIVIGKSADCLDYIDGTDFAMMSSVDYSDSYLPYGLGGPQSDIMNGGSQDGNAATIYDGSNRKIEFTKPLLINDPNGRDYDFIIGDTFYITIVIANESFDGPNYVEFDEVDSKPAFKIHGVQLLAVDEEPTDPEESESNPFTVTLDYGLVDILLIALIIVPTITIVFRKKFKR